MSITLEEAVLMLAALNTVHYFGDICLTTDELALKHRLEQYINTEGNPTRVDL